MALRNINIFNLLLILLSMLSHFPQKKSGNFSSNQKSIKTTGRKFLHHNSNDIHSLMIIFTKEMKGEKLVLKSPVSQVNEGSFLLQNTLSLHNPVCGLHGTSSSHLGHICSHISPCLPEEQTVKEIKCYISVQRLLL